MSTSLGHWMPDEGFHLLRQQGQTLHSVRTRCLAGKKLHLDRRQVQDHFCGTCHRHHHHAQKANTAANDTDHPHRACKGQSACSDAQVHLWPSDRSEPLARSMCFSLSSTSSSSSSAPPSTFCPELVSEQSLKTVTAQASADQTLWRPISSGPSSSSPSSSSSSSQNAYGGSDDDAWSNSLDTSTQQDTSSRHYHSSHYNTHRGGASAHMGIGGRGAIGGGTGESPDPSSGVHPGNSGGGSHHADGSNGAQGPTSDVPDQDMAEDEDGKKLPSSYTFRRRNAVVEGSEDAPRAKDYYYPDASTN